MAQVKKSKKSKIAAVLEKGTAAIFIYGSKTGRNDNTLLNRRRCCLNVEKSWMPLQEWAEIRQNHLFQKRASLQKWGGVFFSFDKK